MGAAKNNIHDTLPRSLGGGNNGHASSQRGTVVRGTRKPLLSTLVPLFSVVCANLSLVNCELIRFPRLVLSRTPTEASVRCLTHNHHPSSTIVRMQV